MKIVICMFALVAITMAGELEDGNVQFTSRMFTEIVKANPSSSVVMSAFSVMPPLAQLALASVGESHDELLRAIGLPNDNVTKEVFTRLTTELRAVKGVELKTANKVYIPSGAELNEQFASVSRDVFDSEVENVDFGQNTVTADKINTWVEDHTNHRIKNLVDPNNLDASTRAVLVNAIYFKGSWKEKFDKALTVERDFHVTKTNTIKVPTMHRKGNFRYGESSALDAKLLEMYYEGDQSSLLIVLPNQVDGINALTEKLTDSTALAKATKDMFESEVDIFIPKFKIETTTKLTEVLPKLGIQSLFQPGKARLDNLIKGESDLYVSAAIQKAFIEVNEEGAEAAAANVFGVSYLSAVISEPNVFDANHPFVFYLNEKENILFNGVYRA